MKCSIRESRQFSTQCETLALGVRRLDEVRCALDWALVHNPLRYPEAPATRIRVAHTDAQGTVPALRWMYTLTEENGELWAQWEWVEAVCADADDPVL